MFDHFAGALMYSPPTTLENPSAPLILEASGVPMDAESSVYLSVTQTVNVFLTFIVACSVGRADVNKPTTASRVSDVLGLHLTGAQMLCY